MVHAYFQDRKRTSKNNITAKNSLRESVATRSVVFKKSQTPTKFITLTTKSLEFYGAKHSKISMWI